MGNALEWLGSVTPDDLSSDALALGDEDPTTLGLSYERWSLGTATTSSTTSSASTSENSADSTSSSSSSAKASSSSS